MWTATLHPFPDLLHAYNCTQVAMRTVFRDLAPIFRVAGPSRRAHQRPWIIHALFCSMLQDDLRPSCNISPAILHELAVTRNTPFANGQRLRNSATEVVVEMDEEIDDCREALADLWYTFREVPGGDYILALLNYMGVGQDVMDYALNQLREGKFKAFKDWCCPLDTEVIVDAANSLWHHVWMTDVDDLIDRVRWIVESVDGARSLRYEVDHEFHRACFNRRRYSDGKLPWPPERPGESERTTDVSDGPITRKELAALIGNGVSPKRVGEVLRDNEIKPTGKHGKESIYSYDECRPVCLETWPAAFIRFPNRCADAKLLTSQVSNNGSG